MKIASLKSFMPTVGQNIGKIQNYSPKNYSGITKSDSFSFSGASSLRKEQLANLSDGFGEDMDTINRTIELAKELPDYLSEPLQDLLKECSSVFKPSNPELSPRINPHFRPDVYAHAMRSSNEHMKVIDDTLNFSNEVIADENIETEHREILDSFVNLVVERVAQSVLDKNRGYLVDSIGHYGTNSVQIQDTIEFFEDCLKRSPYESI